jgi:acyl phosphate:glycerol-3-phosphate acyltransferase
VPEAEHFSHAEHALPTLLLLGYLLGSIPFGLLLTKLAGLGDIRAIGSGNIGATNVLRTGRKGLAAATLVLDALKGTVAVWIGWHYGRETGALAAGFAAYVGHCFPLWLKLKGGKGFATFLGVLLALHWPTMVITALVWLGTAYAKRYSSLAALVASVAAPLSLVAFGEYGMAGVAALMTIIIWVRHRANIARLFAGQESKIGAK